MAFRGGPLNSKYFYLIGIIGLMSFLPPKMAWAAYPGTLWSSQKINETLVGVKPIHSEGPTQNLVTLSPQKLTLNKIEGDRLLPMVFAAKKTRGEWIKLNVFDINGDGREEVIVSGFDFDRVTSSVGQLTSSGFAIWQELPLYLQVITWQGEKVLVGQKSLGKDDFTGPLYRMKWDGKKLTKGETIVLKSGISTQSISIYRVDGSVHEKAKDTYLYLNTIGNLVLFQGSNGKYERKWTSGVQYGGPVYFINREVRSFLNQTEKTRFYVPLAFQVMRDSSDMADIFDHRFGTGPLSLTQQAQTQEVTEPSPPAGVKAPEMAHLILPAKRVPEPLRSTPAVESAVYVIKNNGYLKNVIGAVPSVKNSQLVRLIWTGYGFQETWNSPHFDGAFSDLILVDWDGDGREEVMVTFLLRDKGYIDTLKKQDSLIMVIKPSYSK